MLKKTVTQSKRTDYIHQYRLCLILIAIINPDLATHPPCLVAQTEKEELLQAEIINVPHNPRQWDIIKILKVEHSGSIHNEWSP